MIFFFDTNGNLLNWVSENVYQGSNNANTMYVVAPLPESNQVLAYFTLPNGNVIAPVYATNTSNLTFLSSLELGDTTYSVWSAKLSNVVTAQSGNVTVQFSFINSEQQIRTQSTTFPILQGAQDYEPLDLTRDTTLEDILTNIEEFITSSNNNYEAFTDTVNQNFDTLEKDLKQTIENKLAEGVTDYDNLTNKPIINADLSTITGLTQGYYRHIGDTSTNFIKYCIYYYNGTDFSKITTEKYVNEQVSVVNQKIEDLRKNAYVKVDVLPTPTANTLGKIYLVPVETEEENNYYDEYLTIISSENPTTYAWEKIGNTRINVQNLFTQGKNVTIDKNGEISACAESADIGYNNTTPKSGTFLTVGNNHETDTTAYLIGSGLKGVNYGQVITGKNNQWGVGYFSFNNGEEVNSGDYGFLHGNGESTDYSNRKNAFGIKNAGGFSSWGSSNIVGGLTVSKTPVNETDVVRLKDLQSQSKYLHNIYIRNSNSETEDLYFVKFVQINTRAEAFADFSAYLNYVFNLTANPILTAEVNDANQGQYPVVFNSKATDSLTFRFINQTWTFYNVANKTVFSDSVIKL